MAGANFTNLQTSRRKLETWGGQFATDQTSWDVIVISLKII